MTSTRIREDHDDGEQRRRGAERVEIRPDRRGEREPGDLERQRLRLDAGDEEERAVVVVPRQREAEEEAAEDPRPDERQGHLAERARAVRAEVAGRLLDALVVPVPDREHHEEAERDAPDDVRAERRLPERRLLVDVRPEELRPEREQVARRHQREHDEVEARRRRARNLRRKAIESENASRAVIAPAAMRDPDGLHRRLANRSRVRAGDRLVEERAPPVEAERPLERERDRAELALQREHAHQRSAAHR